MSSELPHPDEAVPVEPLPTPRKGGLSGVLEGLHELPREVLVLASVAFCVALGFGILAPAIPVFAKTFGVSNFWASSVISVFALMRFVSAFGGGWLVNRLGERIVLATGIGIVAALERDGRAGADLPRAAGAARHRRGRVGDVHGLGAQPAAARLCARAARPGERHLPVRLPARWDRRSAGRWPAHPVVDPRAVLRLRRHARRRWHRGDGVPGAHLAARQGERDRQEVTRPRSRPPSSHGPTGPPWSTTSPTAGRSSAYGLRSSRSSSSRA